PVLNVTCPLIFCNKENDLEWHCYLLILVSLFTLSVGLLGNVLALGHYMYCMKTWTTSTVFLFNLAFCDFTWILMAPFSFYYSLQNIPLYSSETFYQVRKLFFNINIYGSIYFLTLISFDRYVGAVHPISSLTWWDKGKATFCTIVVWIFIVIGSVPEIYYTFVARRPPDGIISLDNIGGPLHFVVPLTLSRFLLRFLIPVTVIFTCYMLTFRALVQLNKRQQRRNTLVRPLILISAAVIVFAISFTPYHVTMLVVLIYRINCKLHCGNVSTIFAIYKVTELICSFNSCLDPIIFMVANKEFYQRMKTIKCHPKCQCCCCLTQRV
ncbi:P2RY1 protein, partial [Eudromia elegans]|nr:P2RY1 protein [Eudromia elegans]